MSMLTGNTYQTSACSPPVLCNPSAITALAVWKVETEAEPVPVNRVLCSKMNLWWEFPMLTAQVVIIKQLDQLLWLLCLQSAVSYGSDVSCPLWMIELFIVTVFTPDVSQVFSLFLFLLQRGVLINYSKAYIRRADLIDQPP